MSLRLIAAPLLAGVLFAQDAAYFAEPEPERKWMPQWELRFRADQFRSERDGSSDFDRSGARLRLRWSWTSGPATLVLGSRHALGSDGNARNAWRYDQEPSNGSILETARVDVAWSRPEGYSELRLGLQDNPLLTQESLWDKDLTLTGGAAKAGFRREAWGLEEAGFRAVAGRVRSFPGSDLDLLAAQAVFRGEAGPVGWTLHGGRWDLRWSGGEHRLRPLPLSRVGERQHLAFDAVGAGLVWRTTLPLEVRGYRHRNRETRKVGEELQIFLGGRNRAWWPQAGFVWQWYEAGGTPYPVNGDEWWFVNAAKGPRYLLALPLPSRWLLELSHLRHTWLTNGEPVHRTLLTLTKRFPAS